MKFKYRIIWTNVNKNRQEWCDISDQHIALFIAKKKVSEGMENVLIQFTAEWGDDPNDISWPAVDAKIEEVKGEN